MNAPFSSPRPRTGPGLNLNLDLSQCVSDSDYVYAPGSNKVVALALAGPSLAKANATANVNVSAAHRAHNHSGGSDAVFAVIKRRDKDGTHRYLAGLRRKKEGHSSAPRWGFFGGKINPREAAQAALTRELYEEARILPKSMRHLGTFPQPVGNKTVTYYEVEPSGSGWPRLNKEHSDARWLSSKELCSLPLHGAVSSYLRNSKPLGASSSGTSTSKGQHGQFKPMFKSCFSGSPKERTHASASNIGSDLPQGNAPQDQDSQALAQALQPPTTLSVLPSPAGLTAPPLVTPQRFLEQDRDVSPTLAFHVEPAGEGPGKKSKKPSKRHAKISEKLALEKANIFLTESRQNQSKDEPQDKEKPALVLGVICAAESQKTGKAWAEIVLGPAHRAVDFTPTQILGSLLAQAESIPHLVWVKISMENMAAAGLAKAQLLAVFNQAGLISDPSRDHNSPTHFYFKPAPLITGGKNKPR